MPRSDSNTTYGVANKTYGLTPAPCKACPQNMITSTEYLSSAANYIRNNDGSHGFISPLACVTMPGEAWQRLITDRPGPDQHQLQSVGHQSLLAGPMP